MPWMEHCPIIDDDVLSLAALHYSLNLQQASNTACQTSMKLND